LATIKRGNYSFEAKTNEEEKQLKEFLGISPAGDELDTYLSKLNVDKLNEWWAYWAKIFKELRREDIRTFVNAKWMEYRTIIENGGVIGKGNTLTDAELSKLAMEDRPLQIGFFGKEILAPQLTAEEKAYFGEKNIKETFQAAFLALGIPSIIAGIKSFLGGSTAAAAVSKATTITTGSSATGAGYITTGGFAQGLGIAGLTISEATAKLAVKGAMGIAGMDGIMVWMASDNVLTGTAFTLRKLREAVKSGAISKSQALKETETVQKWIDAATSLVKTSATVNPFIMPFKNILLINAEKAQKDFDLEVALIKKT